MKRIVCLAIIICAVFTLGFSAQAVYDENELISYKSTGETVVRIQLRLRELGYFNFKATGNFQNLTVEATKAFQQSQLTKDGKPIMSDGTVGPETMGILFSTAAIRAAIPQSVHIPIGSSFQNAHTLKGELVNWETVKTRLTAGQSYEFMDYNTGRTFNMIYVKGGNHAEFEAASPNDTSIFKDVFGGEFNYFKRPMLLKIGSDYIASAMQGYPHGEDDVRSNDMAGHVCVFFEGSKSHVGALPDAEYIQHIFKAAGR